MAGSISLDSTFKKVNIFILSFLTARGYIVKEANFCPSTKYLAVPLLELHLNFTCTGTLINKKKFDKCYKHFHVNSDP
jgi:hypothetical protein